MGHSPGEDDFYAIIIGSPPPSYNPFVSALEAMSSVLGNFLSPDDLMQTIADEYGRQTLGRTSKKEENAAFYSNDDGGRGKKKRLGLKCFNCNKKGHKRFGCWAGPGPDLLTMPPLLNCPLDQNLTYQTCACGEPEFGYAKRTAQNWMAG